jgi:hypothetical protein
MKVRTKDFVLVKVKKKIGQMPYILRLTKVEIRLAYCQKLDR